MREKKKNNLEALIEWVHNHHKDNCLSIDIKCVGPKEFPRYSISPRG